MVLPHELMLFQRKQLVPKVGMEFNNQGGVAGIIEIDPPAGSTVSWTHNNTSAFSLTTAGQIQAIGRGTTTVTLTVVLPNNNGTFTSSMEYVCHSPPPTTGPSVGNPVSVSFSEQDVTEE